MRYFKKLFPCIPICLVLLAVFPDTNYSQTSPSQPVWFKFDDRDAGITYSGRWDTIRNNMCYRGSQNISQEDNSELTFTFYGSKLRVFGGKDEYPGQAVVTIDGINSGTISREFGFQSQWYNNSPQYNYILLVADSLKNAKHIVQIKGKGLVFDSYSCLSDSLITYSSESKPEMVPESLGQTSLPQPLWLKFDDRDAELSYLGKWETIENDLSYRGSQHESQKMNSEVTFAFNGFKVRFYGSRNDKMGEALVYIDNVLIESVNCFSLTPKYNDLLFESDSLKTGKHLLKVKAKSTANSSGKGAGIACDAFSCLAITTYSLTTVSVDNKPLIDASQLDREGAIKGFEGGTIIRYKNEYRFFTHERRNASGGQMGLYKSVDGIKWERITTVTPDSTKKMISAQKPWQDCWEPFPTYNEKEERWNIFYNSNMGILRAVSLTPGYDGLEGPYQDVQEVIKYGYPSDPQPSDPWESGQIWSWCHYPVSGDTLYAIFGSWGRMGNMNGLAKSNTGITGPWVRVSKLNPIETGALLHTENPEVSMLEDGNYIALSDGGDYKWLGTPRGINAIMSCDGIHWGKVTYFDLWNYPSRWWKMLRTPLCFMKQTDGNYLMYFCAFANNTIQGFPGQNFTTIQGFPNQDFTNKETLGKAIIKLSIKGEPEPK